MDLIIDVWMGVFSRAGLVGCERRSRPVLRQKTTATIKSKSAKARNCEQLKATFGDAKKTGSTRKKHSGG